MSDVKASEVTELYLLRHAHAGDREDWTGPDDQRPLTNKGRAQSERLGAFLESVAFRPDVIASSPLVRAAQTAEIVADKLGMKVKLDDRLGDSLSIGALEAVLADLAVRKPLLVGHDPDFTMLVGTLCDASGVEMKKGALARIDISRPLEQGAGLLRWLVPPDLLKNA